MTLEELRAYFLKSFAGSGCKYHVDNAANDFQLAAYLLWHLSLEMGGAHSPRASATPVNNGNEAIIQFWTLGKPNHLFMFWENQLVWICEGQRLNGFAEIKAWFADLFAEIENAKVERETT